MLTILFSFFLSVSCKFHFLSSGIEKDELNYLSKYLSSNGDDLKIQPDFQRVRTLAEMKDFCLEYEKCISKVLTDECLGEIHTASHRVLDIVGQDSYSLFIGRSSYLIMHGMKIIQQTKKLSIEKIISIPYSGTPDVAFTRMQSTERHFANVVTKRRRECFMKLLDSRNLGNIKSSEKLYIVDAISTGVGLDSFLRVINYYYLVHLGRKELPDISVINLGSMETVYTNLSLSRPYSSQKEIYQLLSEFKHYCQVSESTLKISTGCTSSPIGFREVEIDYFNVMLPPKISDLLDEEKLENALIPVHRYDAYMWRSDNSKYKAPMWKSVKKLMSLKWGSFTPLYNTIQSLMDNGKESYSKGEFRKAIEFYLEALKHCEGGGFSSITVMLYLNLMISFFRTGEYDNCKTTAITCVKEDSAIISAYNTYGLSGKLRDWKENTVVEFIPQMVELLTNVQLEWAASNFKSKGNELISKDAEGAISAYDASIYLLDKQRTFEPKELSFLIETESKATRAILWSNKSIALFNLKRYAESRAAADEAIKLNPKTSKFYHRRGMAASALKESELALSDFKMALELDSQNAMALKARDAELKKISKMSEVKEVK